MWKFVALKHLHSLFLLGIKKKNRQEMKLNIHAPP